MRCQVFDVAEPREWLLPTPTTNTNTNTNTNTRLNRPRLRVALAYAPLTAPPGPPMSDAPQQVIRFHYSVAEVGQPPMESSREGGQPIAALIGAGNIIPGLEQALIGKNVGDRFEVTVPAAEAYGERNEALTQRVPKKYFPTNVALRPGLTVMLQTQHGPRPVTVLKIGMSVIDVDLNHPMAGKDLSFDIEIVEIRDATEEELAHGHVHGDGGHHH